MKRSLLLCLTTGLLFTTVHRLPAPISEESTPTPIPKPAQQKPAEPKSRTSKPRPKQVDNDAPVKGQTPEPPKPVVTGAWRGHWDNSKGNSGTVTITLTEEVGGLIIGDAGPGIIENGHRTGNVVTYTFHRSNLDYHVTLTVSGDDTTISGGYTVTKQGTVLYSGNYENLKRR